MLTSPYKKPRIAPLQEHPRLMLKKSDVERIKNNFTLKECEEAVALWHTLCDMKIVCEGATPEFGTYDLSEYLSLEAKALRALLSEKREDAREAIECALLLLRDSSFDKGIMKARWSGHLIFVCSEVYDWCYSYLGEDEKSLKIGELWGSNHDHLDTGSFQIYSGGILASDSGMYDSYNTPHRKCYAIRTSAHNCITVSDPKKPLYGEWKEGAPYDGGTRNPCGGKEPKTLESWKEDYRMAKVLSHTESDTVCEIIGDMTEAYFRTCKSAVRRMTWEPEKGEYGTLTVSDSIDSLSDEYVKAFHIHCQREPKVDGRVIVIDNGSCELHCRVLLPSEADISVIGGDGKRFITDGTSYEAQGTEDTEAGWGQIIITHTQRSVHTDFKIEMEIKKKKA